MRRTLWVLLCGATVTMVPAAASATPSSGVSGTVLGKGTSNNTIEVKNVGPTDVVVRHIVIEPGGSTGWHYHPGELIAVVHKGTLTRTLEDCSVQTTSPGQSIVEAAGDRHAHVGRNLGTEPVELYVTYVIPARAPLAMDAADPGCSRSTPGR
ncbi:MAG TPA: cupin domain-containing protein [Pseudonocardiaceae bacterium]|jgi:quercetin dioxygenase-like cupin family protein|nr:cupin domain-containing protein [Pseudonocardiaceae bacterium]